MALKSLKITLFLVMMAHVLAQSGEYSVPGASTSGEYGRPLTDQEAILAKDYVHQGLVQEEIDKICGEEASQKDQDACAGREAYAFGQTGDILVETVAQMYSLFGLSSLGSGSGPVSARKKKGEAAKKETSSSQADKKESKMDYCAMIPFGVNYAANLTQSMRQQAIAATVSTGKDIPQKESLYATARGHEVRAQTAALEKYGWGATFTCYVFSAQKSGIGIQNLDTKSYMKMGAAAFLTAFYAKQEKNNKKYEKLILDLANSLPGKGDCNPITERNCYCSQESTKDDLNYCVPESLAARQAQYGAQGFAVSCVNAQLGNDPNCLCAQNNSCSDMRYRPIFNVEGIQGTALGGQLSNLASAANGNLPRATLSSGDPSQAAFKFLKKVDSQVPVDNLKLTSKQKETAKLLAKAGVPRRLAANLSKSRISPQGQRLLANLKKQGGGIAPSSNIKTQTRRVSKSRSSDPFKKKTKRSRKSSSFSFNRKKSKASTDSFKYAKRAMDRASIRKDDGKSIFEVIGQRYKKTGWQRLDFQGI